MKDEKLDSVDTAFFANELESMSQDVDKKYPDAAFRDIMTVDSSDDEGAEELTYKMFDKKGAADFMAPGAQDSPNVEVDGKKFTVTPAELGLHFTMSTKEVRNARKAGRSLSADKAVAVADGVERKHDAIAMKGDGTAEFHGLFGIVYHPNTTKTAAAAAWSTLTPAEICEDIIAQYVSIPDNTNDVEIADKIALPPSWLLFLKTTERVPEKTETCLTYLERSLDVTFTKHYLLKNMAKNPATLAPGTFNVMMVYRSDSLNLSYLQPMPFRFMAPEYKSRLTLTDSESTSAGVRIKFPLSVVCFYGF